MVRNFTKVNYSIMIVSFASLFLVDQILDIIGVQTL